MTDAENDLYEVYAATFDDDPAPLALRHGAFACPDDWEAPSVVVALGELTETVRLVPDDADHIGATLEAAAERLHRQWEAAAETHSPRQ